MGDPVDLGRHAGGTMSYTHEIVDGTPSTVVVEWTKQVAVFYTFPGCKGGSFVKTAAVPHPAAPFRHIGPSGTRVRLTTFDPAPYLFESVRRPGSGGKCQTVTVGAHMGFYVTDTKIPTVTQRPENLSLHPGA